MDGPLTPKEISLRRYRDLEKQGVQNKRARRQGGYVMLHAPLPFQLPLHEGFTHRWNDEDARQLEIVHYLDEDREPRVGEPIFEPADNQASSVPRNLARHHTVVRIGMPVLLDDIDQFGTFTAHPSVAAAASGFPPVTPAPEPEEVLAQLLDEGLLALNSAKESPE